MFKAKSKTNDNEMTLNISNRTVIRVLALVILSLFFLAAIHKATHALILIFTAFFLALALNAPVHWVASVIPGKRRGNRALATSVSFFIVLALLIGFVASLVPPIVRQTDTFISNAPSLIDDLHNQNGEVGKFVRKYHLESQIDTFSQQLSTRLKNSTGTAASSVSRVGSSIFSLLTILALTFMMLVEGPRWVKFFGEFLPEEKQAHAKKLSRDMYHVIRGYVNGQVFLAALAACLIVPMLFILHISYPVALMVAVFICGLIPMIGHTIGAIIVTSVALFHSLPVAIFILAYYILYQQIENYIIQPRIQANSTNMSPLLVFGSVVIGVSFGGLLGGLVAIPLMGCVRIAVLDQIHSRNLLHDAEEATTTGDTK